MFPTFQNAKSIAGYEHRLLSKIENDDLLDSMSSESQESNPWENIPVRDGVRKDLDELLGKRSENGENGLFLADETEETETAEGIEGNETSEGAEKNRDGDKNSEQAARLVEAKSKLERVNINAVDSGDLKKLFMSLHSEIEAIITQDEKIWSIDLGRTINRIGDKNKLNFDIENIDIMSLEEYREKFVQVIDAIDMTEPEIGISNLCTLLDQCESLKVVDVPKPEMDTPKPEKETLKNRMKRYADNVLKPVVFTVTSIPHLFANIKKGWKYAENYYKTNSYLAPLRWFVDKFINIDSGKYWLFPKNK